MNGRSDGRLQFCVFTLFFFHSHVIRVSSCPYVIRNTCFVMSSSGNARWFRAFGRASLPRSVFFAHKSQASFGHGPQSTGAQEAEEEVTLRRGLLRGFNSEPVTNALRNARYSLNGRRINPKTDSSLSPPPLPSPPTHSTLSRLLPPVLNASKKLGHSRVGARTPFLHPDGRITTRSPLLRCKRAPIL